MPIENLNLPVGRIVWGNPVVPQIKKNMQTKQPVMKDGQQVMEYVCGIAVPKNEFLEKIWPLMAQEAQTVYQGRQVPRDFSYKITDGDSLDPKNIPYSNRTGYAGCYVIKVSTEAFAPRISRYENGAYREMRSEEVKTGDYIIANVDIKGHTNNDGGLYINPNGFRFVGYGEAISSSGGNPEEMFGTETIALPAGASATPIGAPLPQQQQYGAPAMGNQQHALPVTGMPSAGNGVTQAGYATIAQSPSNSLPPPAYDFVNNATGVPTATATQPPLPTQVAAPAQTAGGPPGLPPAR